MLSGSCSDQVAVVKGTTALLAVCAVADTQMAHGPQAAAAAGLCPSLLDLSNALPTEKALPLSQGLTAQGTGGRKDQFKQVSGEVVRAQRLSEC